MIAEVNSGNIREAARVHAISWRESHRSFCTEEFVALHTPERQAAYLLEKMESGSRVYLLIEDGPVGVVSVTGSLIEDLYVLPDRQNRGYGTMLLRYAVERCEGTPTLWILENNSGAERLYRRMGFAKTGRRNAITDSLDEIEFSLEKAPDAAEDGDGAAAKEDGMKTIGLIGGMSWESTVTYYQVINETVKRELGGLHSAKILLYSVDFDEIERYQSNNEWEKSAEVLADAAARLEGAGADFIVICTNSMHKVVPQMKERVRVPIVHIAEATAEALKDRGIASVALLGTKYTMTEDFYKAKLAEAGIRVTVPDAEGVEKVNSVIYDELCLGVIRDESRDALLSIIRKMADEGAQGVVLGCTEIGLLVKQKDLDIPVFDTTLIHAEKAALLSLKG